MRKSRKSSQFALAMTVLLLLSPAAVLAQETESTRASAGTTTPPGGTNTSSRERLFLNFAEDAMIVDEQWWEGWLQYDDADSVDRTVLFGQAAFQPWQDFEVGGRVGFGSTDTPPGVEDGTGATDLDLWGKYFWNMNNQKTEFSAGAILTVPTGDDSAGLGFDAFALKGFGAMRYRLKAAVITGTIGLQINDDGSIFGSPDLDGELSVSAGAGVIVPWSEAFSFIGELSWKTERFDGADDDARLLAGLNLHLSNRSMLRPAISLGLEDGAPDVQIFVGYAYTF
jgi:hypothetical protein